MPGNAMVLAGSHNSPTTTPFIKGPSWVRNAAVATPTKAPPNIFVLRPISLIPRNNPAVSGGYDAT